MHVWLIERYRRVRVRRGALAPRPYHTAQSCAAAPRHARGRSPLERLRAVRHRPPSRRPRPPAGRGRSVRPASQRPTQQLPGQAPPRRAGRRQRPPAVLPASTDARRPSDRGTARSSCRCLPVAPVPNAERLRWRSRGRSRSIGARGGPWASRPDGPAGWHVVDREAVLDVTSTPPEGYGFVARAGRRNTYLSKEGCVVLP